MHTGRDER